MAKRWIQVDDGADPGAPPIREGKYIIQKNVPMPEKRFGVGRAAYLQYPFKDMEVGDSFRVDVLRGETITKVGNRVYAASTQWRETNGFPFRRFSYRGDQSGKFITMWRIEDADELA